MTNNIAFKFLQEMVIRLSKRSPVFFQVLQLVSFLVTVIPGIPLMLDFFHIALGPLLQALANKTVTICGIVALFLTSLPVDTTSRLPIVDLKLADPIIPVEPIIETPIVLPFTDKFSQ